MRILKKIVLLLIAFISVFLLLPVPGALAAGTTVEINNGNPITIDAGQSIAATDSSGIPVAVKNLPDLGAPANGLAAFAFTFTWDKNVINLVSVNAAADTGWTGMLPGAGNNADGRLKSGGFTTTYSTNDVILLYLGVKAVGKVGESTSIKVTVTSLGDKDANPITATSIEAPVKISGAKLLSMAITSASQSLPSASSRQFTALGTYDDASVVNVTSLVNWASSNEAAAAIQTAGSVNPGLVTGLTIGTTTISASLGAISSAVTLNVIKAEEKPVTLTPGQTPVTPSAPGSPSSPAQPAGTNWLLIGAVGASVVIISLVSYVLYRTRS